MAKLVQCKSCGKEIAKGVKKCVHCGKDQRNWFMQHKILTFIGVVLLIGIWSSILGGGSDDSKTDSTSSKKNNSSLETKEKIYGLNEAVNVSEKSEVIIAKFEEKARVGDEFFNKQASEGGTFVAIQASIKNISDKPLGIFSFPSISLVDEKGTEYNSDIDASGDYAIETGVDNSKLLSDLNPGITVVDVKVFEISKDAFASGKWFILIDGDKKVQIK